ncbi:translocon-associated protein subunit gamma-like [Amphibalanus amphitrite]|uniref:translocon-associated protein subunit gamma-like n=1 Tax=Amphibalanus amphitrite TaxID=1232801 RepID=UPI001C90388A|nr:translocon-associated protein subunit gamma-like [Amphibalanus amphitrite]
MPAANTGAKFSNEEELLLQDFSRLYWRIHMMDLYSSIPIFLIITLASTYLVAMAYKNTKFILKHKIAVKREEAVTREMQKKLAEDKKMSKKEKDERTLWKKNEVADYEATTFSIFYNNALFLAIVIVASFYVLRSFAPTFNYVLSVGSGAGLLWLFSTGTK